MTNCERAKKNVDNLEIQTRLIVENLRQCGKEFEASERRRLILENAVIELRANIAKANAKLNDQAHGTYIPWLASDSRDADRAEQAEARVKALEAELAEMRSVNRYHRGHSEGYKEAKEKYEAENAKLRRALADLVACHDEDIGMEDFSDTDSVGSELAEDGKTVVDMKLTFGVLRRARAALEARQ